ncbi:amidase [Streptomyces sp. NPDC002896]|uniref:amidase n=1 Tax=Streptomyces sp. NPDC002896 TaxID=3154438 RepID=UPI003317A4E4
MTDTLRVPPPRTVEAITSGRVRPSEVVTAALERLDATEPHLRAWVRVDRAGALSTAGELDGRPGDGLRLRGVPFGVKDIIDVRGTPTECGSPLRRGRIAGADAWVVARLREAGAIPLGKTVTTEFAYFAPGPTRNPHDLARTPGGSSSGSAAAVAAGVVPLALGSQTAGSLTRPAAFCGVAGFVAPVGSWPSTGITGLSQSLDSVGLVTASVTDLRLVHGVLSDGPRTPAPPAASYHPRLRVWTAAELGDVQEPMRAALARAAEGIRALGAATEDLDWAARTPGLVAAHTTVMAYESARALVDEARHPDRLSAALGELLATGRRITDGDYRAALTVAARARADILAVLTDADAILAPAALGAAPHGLAATGTPVLSRPWQLLGLPVVTVPGYTDDEGMPLGLQLIGHPERVDLLFALGERLERLAREASSRGPAKRYLRHAVENGALTVPQGTGPGIWTDPEKPARHHRDR